MFSIGCHDQWDGNDVKVRAIKNIRLAQGGKKLYDQILEEGRFVTRGILFDVNKATLKPESMGVINQVAKLMQERIDLKFDINTGAIVHTMNIEGIVEEIFDIVVLPNTPRAGAIGFQTDEIRRVLSIDEADAKRFGA